MSAYRKLTGSHPFFLLGREAQAIPQSALEGCRVFADRETLLAQLPRSGRIAEVGTQHGNWALQILETCTPQELHVFDSRLEMLRDEVRNDSRIRLHQGNSSRQLAKLPDASFDWIYIDADHSYAGIRKDVSVAVNKVRKDGLLVFNDYTLWSPREAIPYGVLRCVNELLVDGGWRVTALALTPTGYFDIVLARAATESVGSGTGQTSR